MLLRLRNIGINNNKDHHVLQQPNHQTHNHKPLPVTLTRQGGRYISRKKKTTGTKEKRCTTSSPPSLQSPKFKIPGSRSQIDKPDSLLQDGEDFSPFVLPGSTQAEGSYLTLENPLLSSPRKEKKKGSKIRGLRASGIPMSPEVKRRGLKGSTEDTLLLDDRKTFLLKDGTMGTSTDILRRKNTIIVRGNDHGHHLHENGRETLPLPAFLSAHPLFVENLIGLAGALKYSKNLFEVFKRFISQLGEEETPIGELSLNQFLVFFSTMENNLFRSLCDDPMDLPLSSYFISTSHNSYLIGSQISGKSSVDIYRKILINGCRCVELDCWDGDDGFPIITHGPHQITMCTTVPFLEVVYIIRDFAFFSSPYPVILSIENHTSSKQQTIMASFLLSHLAQYLYIPKEQNTSSSSLLPSPNELKYKILIKAPKEKLASSELIAITSLNSVPFHAEDRHPFNINSLDENGIETKSRSEMLSVTGVRLSRIYPKGQRIDSSNYNPFPCWCKGCQLVALNWQTYDGSPFSLHDGLFQSNGGGGYVLKPPFLLGSEVLFFV